MNVGSDELAWAETCNLLSSDNSFHEHTQSDVSNAVSLDCLVCLLTLKSH